MADGAGIVSVHHSPSYSLAGGCLGVEVMSSDWLEVEVTSRGDDMRFLMIMKTMMETTIMVENTKKKITMLMLTLPIMIQWT